MVKSKMGIMEAKEYYSHIEVIFEMVKCMRGKEVCFLSEQYKFRNIKAHNIAYLFSNMRAFSFDEREYNVYVSCMDYFNMPIFSFDPNLRREQSLDFIKKFKECSSGYDFFIDLEGDANDYKVSWNEAKKIKALFDSYKVPYYVKNSGKGFHFVIPSIHFDSYLPNHLERKEIFLKFSTTLKNLLNLKLIDLTVYDLRRVYKCPYSLDYKTNRVCVPLTDDQFENFSFELTSPTLVISNGIKNRGLMMRNEDKSRNLKKMFEEVLYG